jgi:hypothetical protein
MTERWIPVLAATLGLVGGVAGAAVGGYVANQGQEQRLEEERAARIRELRIATYTEFLRAAETEKTAAGDTPDRVVVTAEAEVALLAGSAELRRAAAQLADVAINWDGEDESGYLAARSAFLDLAHDEIDAGG